MEMSAVKSDNDVEISQKEQRPKLYKNFRGYLKEYCRVTTIQGLNYMTQKNISLIERLWWILVFIFCVGGGAFMITEIYIKWKESPVMVSLATRDIPIYKIPFPAVTICPETKISKTCFDYSRIMESTNLTEKELKRYEYMSMFCVSRDKSTPNTTEYLDEDFLNFLYECKSFQLNLGFCQWMGQIMNCSELFKPILTDEGLCYSFNMFNLKEIYSDLVVRPPFDITSTKRDWDVDDGYPDTVKGSGYPRRAFFPGSENSLIAVFFSKKKDLLYTCQEFSYQGMRASFHMPSRIPRPSEIFFNIGLDRTATATIIPSMMSTSKTVRQYHPSKRGCYFSNERKLTYFGIYSQNNCNMECFTNYTIKECGCVSYYMPRTNSTPFCGPVKRSCFREAQISYPKRFDKVKLKNKDGDTQESTGCNCMPICVDLNYNMELSNGIWEWDHMKHSVVTSSGVTKDEYYASALRVFFKTPFFIPVERNQLYGVSDLISNFGGIMGLFTGFSLFSVAELIYFLTVRIFENRRIHGYWLVRRVDS